MAILSSETLHASCVAIDGRGVLIEGLSGTGKSDLALRLIDRGAVLVSDDYIICTRQGSMLYGAAPATIAGKIEVRGIGLIELPHLERAPLALIVTILEAPPRFPEGVHMRRIAGIDIPQVALAGLEPSTPLKVELALKHLAGPAQ